MFEVSLLDFAGKVIFKKELSMTELNNELFGLELAKGIYFVQVNVGSHSQTIKLLKH
jgi:hypothetical protein